MAKSSYETKDGEQYECTLDRGNGAHRELGEEEEANRKATDKIEKRAAKPTYRPSIWILSRERSVEHAAQRSSAERTR